MNRGFHVLYGLFLVSSLCGINSCQRNSGDPDHGQTSERGFSESYRPASFERGGRADRIGKALSGSHGHYSATLETHHLPALAYGLVVDDSLVFFGAIGSSNLETGASVSEHTLFRIASMTKSFTAMAILKLRDEGSLSLWDPVSTYLPELASLSYLTSDSPPITIFNLLTMTAGFPEDNPWGDRFLDLSDEAFMEQLKAGISLSDVPSVQYEYSNLGFGLLGQIISRVSGLPYQEYITQNILHPLGMEHTFWEYEDAPADLLALGYQWEKGRWLKEKMLHDGAFGAMGGLITSIADFAKYVSFHLSAWPPRNDPETGPIKRSSVREMHSLYHPRLYKDPDRFGDPSELLIRAYGYGLVSMMDREGIREVGHNGGLPGFGSSYMFYPQYGIGIMAFSNLTYAGGLVRSANYRVMNDLIEQGLLIPRRLPSSEILELRKEQVKQLLLTWDPDLEKEIVAANLYMDISRDNRISECGDLLRQLGRITGTGPMVPENQLRGSFLLLGEKQNLQVSFTLSPETDPRVQWLSLELVPRSDPQLIPFN